MQLNWFSWGTVVGNTVPTKSVSHRHLWWSLRGECRPFPALTRHAPGPCSSWCTAPGKYLHIQENRRWTMNAGRLLMTLSTKDKQNSSLTHILVGLFNVFEWIRWKHGCDPSLLSAPGWIQNLQLELCVCVWSNHASTRRWWIDHSLSVWFKQDLVFELVAFTKLQVEDEAWDALQLLAEVLHLQLSDLCVYEHHELPGAANNKSERT